MTSVKGSKSSATGVSAKPKVKRKVPVWLASKRKPKPTVAQVAKAHKAGVWSR